MASFKFEYLDQSRSWVAMEGKRIKHIRFYACLNAKKCFTCTNFSLA